MKNNVIHYDDDQECDLDVIKQESEEYSDERGEAPYYQSFVSLYDFSHHPPRWCHSWACLDGNQIKFYSTRGESEKMQVCCDDTELDSSVASILRIGISVCV